MLFYDTALLPYSPIESLLNPLSSIWRWLFPRSSSESVCDGTIGIEPATSLAIPATSTPKEE
ncbi:hypothetical protein BDV30DRAFT_210700 [Aspergillus minisclerotigenes]|uniref:Uncharacterized protein n=1 Tax=Aspergillus minisclerotigenes TaxID=656917 RepID=A0A5N6J3P0_9EURO|nr:hypothetical protein BDV30DRAFT_210700 [Aspergillus minisclerotigenes]